MSARAYLDAAGFSVYRTDDERRCDTAIAEYNKGRDYHFERKYDQAIRRYDAAIRAWPKYPDPYYCRALIKEKNEDQAGAAADYGYAIQHKKTFSAAYAKLGMIQIKQGNPEEAINNLTLAYRNFDETEVYLTIGRHIILRALGDAYYALEKFDDAIAMYAEGLKLFAEDAVTLNGRGLAYMAKEDYAAAIRDFDEAIRYKSGYADPVRNKARAEALAKGETPAAAGAGGAAAASAPPTTSWERFRAFERAQRAKIEADLKLLETGAGAADE